MGIYWTDEFDIDDDDYEDEYMLHIIMVRTYFYFIHLES